MRQLLCVLLFMFGFSGQAWAQMTTQEKVLSADKIENLRIKAEQGDSGSQYNLGNIYFNGHNINQDYTEAVKWYLKAAEQDHTKAQYSLGLMYAKGQGVIEDVVESGKWFVKSANQGFSYAQYCVGLMYYYGQAVSKDEAEGYFWFVLASINGDKEIVLIRDEAEAKLTPTQIAEIQKRAREWKPVVTQVKQ